MLDALSSLWQFVADVMHNPRVAAACAAMIVSILFGRWRETLLVGFLAYCFIPIFIANPIYPMPKEWASGAGATMAVMGVHGIQARIEQLDFKFLITAVMDRIKGKK
ncbi:hypothetical protein [Modicisalibacter coralii]|uniref:hypothetical protein n=1 Tax=Modicisalibacter coralii TaxID=2304602 RepID=UPI00100AECEB|nr:hypothetical protein [Halomonas coralii]